VKKILLGVIVAAVAFSYCGKKPRTVLPAADQFVKAKDLYDRGKYYRAQLEFENLIYTYPGNTVIDTAQYYLGMSYYNQKDYGLSTGELKRLLTSYPTSAFADDAQYYIAMSHYRMSPKSSLDQSETYLAIDEFNQLISNYPTSSYMADARSKVGELEDKLAKKSFKIGELYLKLNDYKSALTYFAFVRDNYPSTDWAIKAFYYSGEAQLKLNRLSDAKDTFEKFLLGFSDHELALKAREKLEDINAKITTEEG
jgi:outer membrane protein assembly factor BamD